MGLLSYPLSFAPHSKQLGEQYHSKDPWKVIEMEVVWNEPGSPSLAR